MDEQFANEAQSTLAGAITSSNDTITLTSVALFPTSGDFTIRIDDELLRVTDISGSDLTVIRGAENTTAASHSSGAEVYNILTKQSLENFRKYTNFIDLYSNRHTDNRAGRLFIPSDGHTLNLNLDAGWQKSGPIYNNINYELNIFNNTLNEAFSETTFEDTITLFKPAQASANNTILCKSFDFATTWDIKALLLPNPNISATGWEMGLALIDHSTDEFKTFGFKHGNKLTLDRWDDFTTFNANNAEFDLDVIRPPFLWLNLNFNGTNLKYRISSDNVRYLTVYTESLTDFCTPTRHGVYINSGNNKDNSLKILSYLETGTN